MRSFIVDVDLDDQDSGDRIEDVADQSGAPSPSAWCFRGVKSQP